MFIPDGDWFAGTGILFVLFFVVVGAWITWSNHKKEMREKKAWLEQFELYRQGKGPFPL